MSRTVVSLSQRICLKEDPAHKAGTALQAALAAITSNLLSGDSLEVFFNCVEGSDPHDSEALRELVARLADLESDVDEFVATRRELVLKFYPDGHFPNV